MGRPVVTYFEGPMAWQNAKKKAIFGGKSWVEWENREGVACAARATAANVKRAMLESGTQKPIYCLHGYHAYAEIMNWNQSIRWLRNIRRGYWD